MTNTDGTPTVSNERCTGPNPACRAAHRAGRSVHMVPPRHDVYTQPTLVLPTYHFSTVSEGVATITDALANAPTVATDADLYAFRAAGVPHFLPVDWIDPTRR